MRDALNEGTVGDTAKLMMHRLIVRKLRYDPSLMQKAKDAHARQADQFAEWSFVKEWDDLLALSLEELAIKLISRDREMVRLRNSSPFYLAEGVHFGGYNERVRLRRAARRLVTRNSANPGDNRRRPMVTAPNENDQDGELSDANARDRAVCRGIEYAQKDLRDAGGAYDRDELATILLDETLKDVDQLVAAGAILEIRGTSNQRQYPKMQFNADGTVVAGLKFISGCFPSRNPWAILNFLVNPQSSLNGERPIDRLRAGAFEEVAAAARSFGRQGC
jgi:hypothetical protein